MATNHEQVGRALESLKDGLRPFVEREYRAVYGDVWRAEALAALRQDKEWKTAEGEMHLDAQGLLGLMVFRWKEVFAATLGAAERSLASELRETRNRWAHQQAFSTDDTYRALDTMQRLLSSISAPQAAQVERQKQETLRARFEEQGRSQQRRAAAAAVAGQPQAGLRPWREVVTPHPDVASGRYQQAEFAADLNQVLRGEGADEYRDPVEFFRRTFLTNGLHRLLSNAALRLTGNGGDPVVELQTNFGGGKTHSMLALYHLFSGTPLTNLDGMDAIRQQMGFAALPTARRAVLVGTALSPAQPSTRPDGTVIHTLWGELAYQLGGRAGYARLEQADRQGISPGSDTLRDLFASAAPCLILIDEWVAYVRQLYQRGGLSGGSFDANLTFAQALTEAARQVPKALVVASIPASDIEVGGDGGREALARIGNTFGRMESAWQPASADEGFEIVRRRLFQPLTDPQQYQQRDAVVAAFRQHYATTPADYPSGCAEGDYKRRLELAYPIHPELFDRLYNDWGSLEKFQRTRGVLRLMAAVIHTLWERQDAGLLIMPASIPVDDDSVQYELTRYLDSTWQAVLATDVDGPTALPLQIDRDNSNLGRCSAARRVARTIFIGSAPLQSANRHGPDERGIKLGCVQPGESAPLFGDALRRLTDAATHLYSDSTHYWYTTQASVARLAQDRAAQISDERVRDELTTRLRQDRQRGEFAAVHIAPDSTGDVPDDAATRLVILGPDAPHSRHSTASLARQTALTFLTQRANAARRFANTLVFLAADETRLVDLISAARTYLAWKSIDEEREVLNLDTHQRTQASTKRAENDRVVTSRIPETYIWALVPGQSHPDADRSWEEVQVKGSEGLAVRTARRLLNDELLIARFGAVNLRHQLDDHLWRQEDHLSVKTLWAYFASYLYLPRLRDDAVLVGAIQDGLRLLTWTEVFAYAQHFDAASGRYVGLVYGQPATILLDGLSVLVKPAAAQRQIAADEAARLAQQHSETTSPPPPSAPPTSTLREPAAHPLASSPVAPSQSSGPSPLSGPAQPAVRLLRRFHASASIDSLRVARDVQTLTNEVIQHLTSLVGAAVTLRLEIEADMPDGVPEQVRRAVDENCRTLRLRSFGFEEE